MTRAPRSASVSVQNGPASTRVRSMTVIPDSGPASIRLTTAIARTNPRSLATRCRARHVHQRTLLEPIARLAGNARAARAVLRTIGLEVELDGGSRDRAPFDAAHA